MTSCDATGYKINAQAKGCPQKNALLEMHQIPFIYQAFWTCWTIASIAQCYHIQEDGNEWPIFPKGSL